MVTQCEMGGSARLYGFARVFIGIQDYRPEFPESLCHGCFPGGNAAR